MLNLPKETKLQLYKLLIAQPNVLGSKDIIGFIELIWDLRSMPSEDPRFQDAYGDANQHLVNNNDWDFDYLFLERLRLLENNENFNSFLLTIVSPIIRQTEDEIIKFIFLIEPFIEKYNFFFVLDDHAFDGLPIYTIKEKKEGSEFFFDLKENKLPFFIVWNRVGRPDRIQSHTINIPPSSFVLYFNNGWNDYRIMSAFHLYYCSEEGEVFNIGPLKIISDSANQSIEGEVDSTFIQLTEHYCSLGQTEEYYRNLKKNTNKDYLSVLFALRDASLFPDNHERFEKNPKFKNSVIRFDGPEQLLRIARYISFDYDLQNLYNFKYSFQPKYAEDVVEIDFEFSKEHLSGNRIYALIGKNGTGKTQLITSLPLAISKKEDNRFLPRSPLFSKVIAVSYSIFDQFEIPKKTASFNYVYCGLRKDDGEHFTEKGLVLRFYASWKKVQKQSRLDSWKLILSNFVTDEFINSFIVKGNKDLGEQEYKIDPILFQDVRKKLSSGQSIVFFIITEIIANIRYDSLLIYDEPETHLHPNAISELIYVIHELVKEFQSYCIIATHSPVIIRELFSKNVHVLERTEDILSIRKIGIESFGEDIGVLTDEVFGNKEVPKRYKKTIDELAVFGNSFDEIVSRLESDNVPLSLNTRLYIRSAVKRRNA